MRHANLKVAAMTLAAGAIVDVACSVLNRIDTCDDSADIDRQVNSTTGGDQIPGSSQSLARIASGLYVAAWVSMPEPTDGAPSQLRATLLQADGTVVSPCGSVSGDVEISTASDRIVERPSVSVGPTASSPIFFAWRSAPIGALDTGRGDILVRLMTQDLCQWNPPPLDTFTAIFTASESTDNGAAPVVAVRSDGQEALVAWASTPLDAGITPWLIRSRPVGIANLAIGRLEPNGCDGRDAPCTHAAFVTGGVPTITAFGTGYALAWTEPRADAHAGRDVRMQVLDRLGAVVSDHRGMRPFGDVLAVDLASAATDTQILLAEAGEPRVEVASPDDNEIFLERFDSNGASLGFPERVNSITAGAQKQPALTVVRDNAVFVAWSTSALGGMSSEVFGRVLDVAGKPLFGGIACDSTDFHLSSSRGTRRAAPSLAGDDATVLALFGDHTTAPGGTDSLGSSIHVRRFDIAHLFPQLR